MSLIVIEVNEGLGEAGSRGAVRLSGAVSPKVGFYGLIFYSPVLITRFCQRT